MRLFEKTITEVIAERFSCRIFNETPIPEEILEKLQKFITGNKTGPFREHHRFNLIASGQGDDDILKGLGTYGFIRNATGYLIGASQPGGKYLEDFGYLMEKYILAATAFGLGTCWLGGSFTRSRFSRKILLQSEEEIPAVAALGIILDPEKARNGLFRRIAESKDRRKWETMFHMNTFDHPLDRVSAGNYARPLDMVRIGPSASNKQPWQIVFDGSNYHFFLKRTPGYRDGKINKTLSISDLQRIDIGIAMCHFELTTSELGLKGSWQLMDHNIPIQDNQIEYSISWKTKDD
ncbi:nitroreductase family protein [Chloroflexota bacterium]